MNNLHDRVERWLVQDGHSVNETKTEDNIKIIIKNIDAFSNYLEIFEPKQQTGVLVIGVKIPLKSKQMMRYRQLNQKEKENQRFLDAKSEPQVLLKNNTNRK